jgi:type IV pilus assembly protein PilW
MKDNKGFTLIEVMLALVISTMLMAGIYSIFSAQSTARRNQKDLVDMMQNLRAGIYYMEREIRVAGFDPTGLSGAGIIRADISDIVFTLDDNQDGDLVDGAGNPEAGERIRYFLSVDADPVDGIADEPGVSLMREADGAANVLARNVQALQFFYFDQNRARLDDDGAGNVTGNINNIVTVQIALVARGENGQRGYNNSRAYNVTLVDGTNLTTYPAALDSIQRELLTTAVRCRNL